MPIPYLEKINVWWCKSCDLPLLEPVCDKCSSKGKKITITPPGDIRPALEGDISEIFYTVIKQYGYLFQSSFEEFIKERTLLLNKIPYDDRMDELILGGEVIGLFRYNISKMSFEFIPRVSLARELWRNTLKGCVFVDKTAGKFIAKGASVLAPGIIAADPNITIDDPVIVISNNKVIAVGLAKMNGIEMVALKKGVAVKTKYHLRKMKKIAANNKKTSWDDVIIANNGHLKRIEDEAINFIKEKASDFDFSIVSISGGKDSLVVLDLAYKAKINFKAFFINTSLEFRETVDIVEKMKDYYNMDFIESTTEGWDFWERFKDYGPPTRNSRWCCKSIKLTPVNRMLASLVPDDKKITVFIGSRRFESFGRSSESRTSNNPWTPQQISSYPIHHWSALEVYLYIFKHNLRPLLNPLYNKGLIRIGCWPCPASSMADFYFLKKEKPDLYAKLEEHLEKYRKGLDYSNEYISWGLWRWKKLPKKILDLMKSRGISLFLNERSKNNNNREIKFKMLTTLSPCKKGGFSCLITSNTLFDLTQVERYLPIIGKISYDESIEVITVVTPSKIIVNIFPDGTIELRGDDYDKIKEFIPNLLKTLVRGIYCDDCGLCTFHCKPKALVFSDNHVSVDQKKCIHCFKCNDFCPIIRYYNKTTFYI